MFLEFNVLPRTKLKARGNPPKLAILQCDMCGVIFEKKSSYRLRQYHYCTEECSYKHRGLRKQKRVKQPCAYCRNVVEKTQCHVDQTNWFCNSKCYGKWRSQQDFAKEHFLKNMNRDDVVIRRNETIRAIRQSDLYVHSRTGQKHTDETREKISKIHIQKQNFRGEKNGMWMKKHTMESREKMSDTRSRKWQEGAYKSHTGHKSGDFFSLKMNRTFRYRSSWEHAFMVWLDMNENVVSWFSESVRIPYYYRENKRYYVPDFIVEYADGIKRMFEIKPVEFIESEKNKLKTIAGQLWCSENGILEYRILTKDELVALAIL